MSKIEELTKALIDELEKLDEAEKINEMNEIKKSLHRISPFKSEPVKDKVTRIDSFKNKYRQLAALQSGTV